jgi:hypothetical protein
MKHSEKEITAGYRSMPRFFLQQYQVVQEVEVKFKCTRDSNGNGTGNAST